MKKIISLSIVLIAILITSFVSQSNTTIKWKKVDEGLFYAEYDAPKKSKIGNSKINILKISPELYNFNLISAKENNERVKTADNWAWEKKQIAIINAGMYMQDFATNVGFMKNFNYTNNNRVSKDNTIVAFNRKNDSVPEFQIIDKTCQNWSELKNQYNSLSQSIRMVDCNQKNKWGQQAKKWSMVSIGKDKQGNALFIFSRSPYSVHDFIDILLSSSLDLYNLMYLEGGPEASFYIDHNNTKVANMGSYETGFNENDDNKVFWPIPNVIGITKK